MINLNNGFNLPDIGLGTFPYKEELYSAIPEAYKIGYRLVDTSDNYNNEIHVGKALKMLSEEQRKDIVVVTKYSSPGLSIKEAFNNSAEKLDTPIDVYLMHWPYPFLWERRWREMEELYLEGKCMAIGVCNFTSKYLEQLLKICKVKPMLNQFECHPMFQQTETYDLCRQEGIQVISYSPLARMNKALFTAPILLNLAKKFDKSVGQIILRWDIQTGRMPIPASKSAKHLEDNFNVFDFSLSNKDIVEINSLESGMRIRFNPDTRFSSSQKMHFLFKNIKESLGL